MPKSWARSALPQFRLRRATWLLSLAITIVGVSLWLMWSPLDGNEVVGGDEGYYGTMARNILSDARYLVGPSLSPLGPPGDKPPLYPAILALSIRALGPTATALRWPNEALAVVLVLCVAWLVAHAAARAALTTAAGAVGGDAAGGRLVLARAVAPITAALMVGLPWLADTSRVAAAEPLLTTLGALALVIVSAGASSRARAAVSGLLIGLAFLCKLWLVALVALPVVALLWPDDRRRFSPLAVTVGVAFIVSSLQLAAVAVFAPESLAHWLRIYFDFSLAGRAGGRGFADYWLQPPGYYAALLAHALAPELPLVALGVVWAARRWREPVPRALLAWALGALPLSLFAVKSGVYAYVIMPAYVAIAGLGAFALASGERPSWIAMSLAALAGSPLVINRLGGRGLPPAPWVVLWVIVFGLTALARWRPRTAGIAALALVGMAVGGGLAREAQRLPMRYHAPGYGPVMAALAPRLASLSPSQVGIVTPEAPAFAFHLFRSGRYWGTPGGPWAADSLAAVAADTSLHAFVVDTERTLYGGWPDSTALAWLERSTREITGEIKTTAGAPPRFRVFVR